MGHLKILVGMWPASRQGDDVVEGEIRTFDGLAANPADHTITLQDEVVINLACGRSRQPGASVHGIDSGLLAFSVDIQPVQLPASSIDLVAVGCFMFAMALIDLLAIPFYVGSLPAAVIIWPTGLIAALVLANLVWIGLTPRAFSLKCFFRTTSAALGIDTVGVLAGVLPHILRPFAPPLGGPFIITHAGSVPRDEGTV